MIIIINNKKYDITEFINEHPGGSDVFIDGADMTEEFNKIGHSKDAIKLLEKYLIPSEAQEINLAEKERPMDIESISIYDFLLLKFKVSKFSKLFTHEDYLNIHKILGFITLLNFISIVFDLIYSGSKGALTLRKIDLSFYILLIIQLLLSLSSLQFKIPRHVNYTAISIGEEYRLHSVLFVIRHFLVILILYFLKPSLYSHIFISIIVLTNMYFADLASNHYKQPDNKLGFKIGQIPFWTNCNSYLQTAITTIYTLAQIYTTFILTTGKSTTEMNVSIIFIIQITAFMGTLSRKNIINNFQWHMIYLFQYALFYLAFFRNTTILSLNNTIFTLLFWMLRTKLNVNKFFLWSCVSVIILFTKYIKSNILLCSALGIIYTCFQKYNLCFDKKREETHTIIKTNVIVPETKLHIIDIKLKHSVDYKPGQYFNLYMDKEKRPYTPIASDIENNSLRFFIKDYANNKISEKICALKKDMCIHLEGPFGKSYYDKTSDLLMVHNKIIETKNILFFYCGTGITPFASIINSLNPNTRYKINMFGSLRTPAENYFQDIKQKLFYSANKLTPRKIHKIIKKYKPLNTTIFVCGNKNYMNMLCDTIADRFNICKLE